MKRFLALIASLTSVIGCEGRSTEDRTHVEVRDSVGIRIVEHEGLPAHLPRWVVSANPAAVIGSVEGGGPDVFGRVESVAELANGVIVVADGLRLELNAFDRSGAHLWSAGQRGEGPGEFTDLEGAFLLSGDSILAIGGGRFASIFDAGGRFSRRLSLDPPTEGLARPTVAGVTRSGTIVASGTVMPRMESMESGYYRWILALLSYDMNGELTANAGELPDADGMLRVADGRYTSWLLPLGRRTQFAVGVDGFAATTQERFEVLRYDSNGDLEMILRVDQDPVEVDGAVRRQYVEHGLDEIDDPGMRTSIRQSRQRDELPETLPAVGRLHYDADDRLWVEEYVPPYEGRPPAWWVFDREGEVVAEASVPGVFTMHQIEADHALGVVLDEFDVPYVQVRGISRGSERTSERR